MLKKTLLIALGALLCQGAYAEILSPEAALQRVASQKNVRHLVSATAQPKLAYTAKTFKGQDAVYVFTTKQGDALILSGSDKAIPVLGYTDSGTFDPNSMPPQMKYWLEEYAAQIAYAEENNLAPVDKNVSFSYPTDWSFIAPLVQTKWDQGKPYNSLLTNPGYATGCVATAMAQIMNYHKYPEIGHGSIKYTDAYKNTFSMSFYEQPFDWNNMLNEYVSGKYNDTQANAVAYLMKACGYSTQMNYGSSSGTQSEKSALALATYFDYDSSIDVIQRYGYTHTDWATTLYNQLKNVGPVLYSGHSIGDYAHAFVCDGYDGQGYFHINWGWSGLCDGYYSIDAMNPTVQGTGGSDYGGYNFSQGMVINIMKAQPGSPAFTPKAEFILLGNMTGENAGSILTLTMSEANPGNLVNSSLVTIKPTFAIEVESVETGKITYSEVSGTYFAGKAYNLTEFGPGSFIDPQFSVRARFDTTLPNGKYKVTLVWRNELDSSSTWDNFIISTGCHDYVYVTKEDNKYTVESLPIQRFSITSAKVLTPLYMRNPVEIQFTVNNPYDVELSQGVIPVLLYGDDKKLSFEGDSQLITVGPKETRTVTAIYTFSQVSGGTSPTTSNPRDYTLGAYDYGVLLDRYYKTMPGEFRESYYGDLGTVTMKRPGSNASIRSRGLGIVDAPDEGMMDGVGYIYRINNFSNINIFITIEGTNGFVASPLSAVVTEFDPTTGSTGAVVYETEFPSLIFVEAGETTTYTTTLKMTEFDVSKMYNIQIFYVQQNSRMSLGNIRFGATTGLDPVSLGIEGLVVNHNGTSVEVTAEAGLKSVVLYDMSGKLVSSPACNGADRIELSTTSLSKGLYIVKATDKEGNTKTLKINI